MQTLSVDISFSYLGMASVSDYGGSVNGLSMLGVDGLLEKRRAVLNLYLLSNVSPMLMLIRSAWSTYLLVKYYDWGIYWTIIGSSFVFILRIHSNKCPLSLSVGKSLPNTTKVPSEYCFINELGHDKTNKVTVHPAKTQISLGIWTV